MRLILTSACSSSPSFPPSPLLPSFLLPSLSLLPFLPFFCLPVSVFLSDCTQSYRPIPLTLLSEAVACLSDDVAGVRFHRPHQHRHLALARVRVQDLHAMQCP
eukprot:3678802-Rhodomonas_salina.1